MARPKEFYRLAAAREIMGIGTDRLKRWIQEGKIKAIDKDLIARTELERILGHAILPPVDLEKVNVPHTDYNPPVNSVPPIVQLMERPKREVRVIPPKPSDADLENLKKVWQMTNNMEERVNILQNWNYPYTKSIELLTYGAIEFDGATAEVE